MDEKWWEMSEEELLALDAQYASFPSFAEWVAKTRADRDTWTAFRLLLAQRRETVTAEQLTAALEFVARAAAVDTGAIEGLYTTDRGVTITVAQQAVHWEQDLAAHGRLAVELFEAQLRTFELVLDAATNEMPVTEAWIRRLHEELCAPQQTHEVYTPVGRQERPFKHGAYKEHRNHVRVPDGSLHAYAPVARVTDEMHRLVTELNSHPFASAHPVHQASYAHYAFVVIHPFADGNGRVARALASTYFYRDLSVPLVVLWDEQAKYREALRAADAGDWSAFVRFIERCGIDAVQLVADTLQAPAGPALDKAMEKLAAAVGVDDTGKPLDWGQVGLSLLNAALDELQRVGRESLPGGTTITTPRPAKALEKQLFNRSDPVTTGATLFLNARNAGTGVELKAYRAARGSVFDIVVGASQKTTLGARWVDVVPELSPALRLRLAGWAQTLVAEMAEMLAEELR